MVSADPVRGAAQRLGLGRGGRDGWWYVPRAVRADQPVPMVVVLHGAGANGQDVLPIFTPFADTAGLVVIAPESRGLTWDVLRGGFGPDVAFLDQVLAHVFARQAVDPAHVALSGFSDGASYALSLGLANGDLFTHLIAFSPGFALPPARVGAPRIFVTHGTEDRVLRIDPCSRRLVPKLRAEGYALDYEEFPAGHMVPPRLANEALRWMLGQAAGT